MLFLVRDRRDDVGPTQVVSAPSERIVTVFMAKKLDVPAARLSVFEVPESHVNVEIEMRGRELWVRERPILETNDLGEWGDWRRSDG